MSWFGSHHATPEEEKAAIKTLGERLKDGTQPVEEQLLQVVQRLYSVFVFLISDILGDRLLHGRGIRLLLVKASIHKRVHQNIMLS